MILLRDSINVVLPAIVGKPAGAGPTAGEGHPATPIRVLCSMGITALPNPRAITDVSEAANGSAVPGLAKFRELRTQYYGGLQYDFTEGALVTIARRAITAKKPDDAIACLQANLEYFPKSAGSQWMVGSTLRAAEGKLGEPEPSISIWGVHIAHPGWVQNTAL
jgi:hypothetical protein